MLQWTYIRPFEGLFLKRGLVPGHFGLPTWAFRANATWPEKKRFGYLGHSMPSDAKKKVTTTFIAIEMIDWATCCSLLGFERYKAQIRRKVQNIPRGPWVSYTLISSTHAVFLAGTVMRPVHNLYWTRVCAQEQAQRIEWAPVEPTEVANKTDIASVPPSWTALCTYRYLAGPNDWPIFL